MINFRQNLYSGELDFTPDGAASRPAILTSMELRLKSVLVKDNNTVAVAPYPGFAKIYFLSLIACNLPGSSLRLGLKGFEQVDSGDALNLDKSLFYWGRERPADAPPVRLFVLASLIKSKQPLRDAASVLSEVQRDNSYKLLAATLDNLVKDRTPGGDIANLLLNLAGIAGKYLGKVAEKPLFSAIQGFTGLDAGMEVLGKSEAQAANRYASVALSLVVSGHPKAEETAKADVKTANTLF